MTHRDGYIWLSVPGGVTGVALDSMNQKIKEYNSLYYRFSDFFDWLSWEEGETFYGFSFWNNGSRIFSKLLTIRASEAKEGF